MTPTSRQWCKGSESRPEPTDDPAVLAQHKRGSANCAVCGRRCALRQGCLSTHKEPEEVWLNRIRGKAT